MSYISLSDKDIKEMLDKVGVPTLDDLFQSIPAPIRLRKPLPVPGPLAEPELLSHFEKTGGRNSYDRYLSFLGAGAYDHFIPSVVDYLSSRGEFVSPYTPYQPEVSQGTLQIVFEYQTLICQLSGLDIANASLYDGATAAAEAVLMAHRVKAKTKVLVGRTLHPQYRHVIRTYIQNLGVEAVEFAYGPDGRADLGDLAKKLDGGTAAVVFQSPNFFGVVEDVKALSELAHGKQALSVAVVAEAASLGILEAPGKLGADIVTGEAQSFGMPLSYGGPYLGFMACAKDFVRQLPGRIAGQTVDVDGKRGFVLTLSTREQHIRRESATSNICSNQALCAVRATMFLETLGEKGLREWALQNVHKARYALNELGRLKGVHLRFGGPVFNEFVLELGKDWAAVETALRAAGIVGGYGLGRDYPELKNAVLVCVTEKHRKDDIDRLVKALREALR
jgi:glycine dehydrogenase subunit 1